MLLRKKIYQISLAVAIFAFGSLFFTSAALAILPENPNEGDLIVNFRPNPLFSDGNLLPGDAKIGEAEVINNTGETKRIATEAINYPKNILGNVPDDDLSRALEIVIREDGSDLYGGSSPTGERTLFDFYKNGETYLSDVSGSGGTKTYQFEISFPIDKEDEWQGTTTRFDIIVGFQGTEGGVEYCNYNGVWDEYAGETGVDCGGGGCPACGGGGGGGLPPGLTILDESVRITGISEHGVTIIWTTSYFSTSQVVYAAESEAYEFSLTQPNYGYPHAAPDPEDSTKVTGHLVTIAGLSPNTKYYYRAISHASPPTISREHSFTTLVLSNKSEGDKKTEAGTGESKEAPEYLPPSDGGNAGEASGEISFRMAPVPKTSDGGDSAGNSSDLTNSGNVLGASSNTESAEKNVSSGGSASKPLLAGIEDQNTQSDSARANQDNFGNFMFILLILIIICLVLYIVKLKKNQKKNV